MTRLVVSGGLLRPAGVEGMLEEPDFDIVLFCEMKLDKVQVHRVRKRLAASGWSSAIHTAVVKARSDSAEGDLLRAGAAQSMPIITSPMASRFAG